MTNREKLERLVEACDYLTKHVGRDYLNNKQLEEIEKSHECIKTIRQAIEEMLAENERLRGALEDISSVTMADANNDSFKWLSNCQARAKQALGESE